MKFEIVTRVSSVRRFDSLQEVADAGYVIGEPTTNGFLRAELQGQPRIAGLLGPMWGGDRDGYPVIRYEDNATYAAMSN